MESINNEWPEMAAQWKCPEWFKDVKFGLWLHWGPQTVPEKGGGWYARHMYMSPPELGREKWGSEAWLYHRQTYGHQSKVGYKDVCRLWKAEKFDPEATIKRFADWGARYVATAANHHDNYDLFASSLHGWNATKVGPERDILGEFAEAARRQNLKWCATVHCMRAAKWLAPAFGSDAEGPLKGVPYDGNLTREDGRGTWWEGLDPQQLYAHKYEPFAREVTQRHLELVMNYRPDMLYFDDGQVPLPMRPACARLYAESIERHGSIQALVTVKKPETGTLLDFEKGVDEKAREEDWQTDTTIAGDWFLKPNADGSSQMRHNARSLKELLVDIVSKRGALLLNIAVRADGTIPGDQAREMDELGAWLKVNGEAVYGTRPWKVFGEGGATVGGHFNERGIDSAPWDHCVRRFTRNRDNTILYVHVFGSPAGKELTISSLAAEKGLFCHSVADVTLLGNPGPVEWVMGQDGLHVGMPASLPCRDCVVLRVRTKN